MENFVQCPHCGQKHSADMTHCPVKGLPIYRTKRKSPVTKIDKKTWLIGGAGAAFVLISFWLILFFVILPAFQNQPPKVVEPPFTVPTLTLPPLETRFVVITPQNNETPQQGTTQTNEPTATTWEACENASLPSRLHIGATAQVALDPPLPNRVRQDPNTSAAINGYVDPGESVTIIDGPACDQDWVWWKVEAQSGSLIGWTAEGDQENYWLVPVP